MKPAEFKDIAYDKDEQTGIVTVVLNTPARKNALSAYSFLELWWAADNFQKDEGAHVMIITGARDPNNSDPSREAFSSGGYFNPDATDGVSPQLLEQLDPSDIAQKRLVEKMCYLDKPVIAAVNGLAIGGAFTLVLSCCDLVYMSEHAWIRLPFVRLGLVPELASSFLLPRLIGMQKTKELMFFGEDISAEEALGLGLVNKVVSHDELMSCVLAAAGKLIPPNGPAMAVRLTKRLLNRQLLQDIQRALDDENTALNQAMKSEDFTEAVTARVEKRNPVYRGR